jgi:hypothetical protein
MAAPQIMPVREHRTAPTFTADQPRELRRYFQELNNLFTDCQVADDQTKKSYACRYLDVDSTKLWELLPEFQATSTYSRFIEAVYKLYPGSEDERKWSIADMDNLVGEQLRIGEIDPSEISIGHFIDVLIKPQIIESNRSGIQVRLEMEHILVMRDQSQKQARLFLYTTYTVIS